jgi:O-acetyl-ADP-ribose deacetylase (regulator of RNase III)
MAECRKIGHCPTGQAVVTTGGNLKARYVIHTVGPVWSGGRRGEAELLASCYRESLQLAGLHQLKSIAFPAISCGAYGYPLEQAVKIAVRECAEFAAAHPLPESIIFACFDAATLAAYQTELARP